MPSGAEFATANTGVGKTRVEMVSRADIGGGQKNDAPPEGDADLCRNNL